MTWAGYAILSALCAALVSIFGKLGVRGVDSNLAVAIRTCVILVFAWAIVLVQGRAGGVRQLGARTWLFLVLSALATGASWLCYYRALQLGPVSRVAPVDKLSVALSVLLAMLLLGERPGWGGILGAALITAGVLVSVLVP
jgi:transporter family protein